MEIPKSQQGKIYDDPLHRNGQSMCQINKVITDITNNRLSGQSLINSKVEKKILVLIKTVD